MKKLLLLFILIPFINFSQTQIGQDINGTTNNLFSGSDIELSVSGDYIIISEPFSNDNGTESGGVKIFKNQSNIWIQEGSTIIGDGLLNYFGWNVEIADNGNIVAISTPYNSNAGASAGQAKVYRNENGDWSQVGLDIEGLNNDQLGWGLSLSDNGEILAVGSPSNDSNGSNSGNVIVYENQLDSWVQIGSHLSGDNNNDQFGFSLDLSGNGLILAIASPFGLNSLNVASGYVKIYENQNGNWIQLGSTIEGEINNENFGRDLELSNDGNRIIITGPGSGPNPEGNVKIYENQNGNWIQLGSTLNGDLFGNSVSISNIDSSLITVGSRLFNNSTGKVDIYRYSSNNWLQIGSVISGDNTGDQLGFSVNIKNNILAVGAPNNDDNGSNSGKTKVFDLSNLLSTQDNTIFNFNIYPNPTKNQFTIQLEDNTELENVNIYNNLGQLVLTSKKTVINSSKIASGLYVVEIETNKGKGTKKLIIE